MCRESRDRSVYCLRQFKQHVNRSSWLFIFTWNMKWTWELFISTAKRCQYTQFSSLSPPKLIYSPVWIFLSDKMADSALKERKVTCGQVWCPILGICALHLTHSSAHTQQWEVNKHTHTHNVNTHPEQWAANAAAPEEQLGVRCFAQGHLSRGIEGGESAGYSLPPPTIPAGPETQTHDLWVTSLTLYPLGHDCPKNALNLVCFVFSCLSSKSILI